MKKLLNFVSACVLLLTFAGCTNPQKSSKEEAIFLIEHQSDFKEIVQYLSFEATGIAPMCLSVKKTSPALNYKSTVFVHEVIYKTKDDSFKMVLISDTRPAKIVVTKEFK